MILDLENKANNEKYFKSIRYFSHSLKGEKRRAFIAQVAEYNMHLAAQCIMSAEKDEELENRLIKKAQSIAQNFSQPEKSAKGFLALADFGNYEIISKLFINIQKISNAHLAVIDIILSSKNSELFLSFLSIFVQTDNFNLLKYSIKVFDGEVYVYPQNAQIIKNIIEYIQSKDKLGELSFFIDNFKLYPHLVPIGLNIIELVNQLKDRTLLSIMVSCNIAKYYSLLEYFPIVNFIDNLCNKRGKNSIFYPIKIAVDNDIKNNKNLNYKIFREFKGGKLHTLIKNKKISIEDVDNFNKYLQDNAYLISRGINNTEHYYEHADEKLFYQVNKVPQQSHETTDINTIAQEIENLLTKNRNRILVDKEFAILSTKWNISLMEISHSLRIYELKGVAKHIMDYGCYVQPQTFRTEKLLFLHKNQITEKQEVDHPSELLKEGDLITFRIIGINQQNHRLNISCLDSFKPENNGAPTDE